MPVSDGDDQSQVHTPFELQNCGPGRGEIACVSLMHCCVGTGDGTVQFAVQQRVPRVMGSGASLASNDI